MKTIALIGANGQLANDIFRVFDKQLWRIYCLYHRDIEIKDSNSISKCLTKLKANIIINTAAYHNTDLCEENGQEAFAVNTLGVRNLCFWCAKNACTLVHFSTDYVFGSDKNRDVPYEEEDPVGPINLYGVSKVAGEFFIQSILKRYFLIRTSGLFGSAGSSVKGGNFVDFIIRESQSGRKMKVVSDQIFSPTYTKNVAENLEVLLQTNNFGLYHMVSQNQCSWFELARTIGMYMNLTSPIQSISTKIHEFKAQRPLYSVLANKKLQRLGIDRMNTWQDNIRLYLQEKRYI